MVSKLIQANDIWFKEPNLRFFFCDLSTTESETLKGSSNRLSYYLDQGNSPTLEPSILKVIEKTGVGSTVPGGVVLNLPIDHIKEPFHQAPAFQRPPEHDQEVRGQWLIFKMMFSLLYVTPSLISSEDLNLISVAF